MNKSPYQIGGSLPKDSPTYVVRKADTELYENLKLGNFCYVLNSRQMGKSSLLVRTMDKLQLDGFSCAVIDLSDIGSKSLEQWYGGIAYKILSNFNLFHPIDFMNWWEERNLISPVQRLGEIFDEVLEKISEKIIIFIDEIDSVISLKEPEDDFFALIRSCYNKRSQNSSYQRLTFALLGVATPSDLINDPHRTPFNIGKAIELEGLKLSEINPLMSSFNTEFQQQKEIITEILYWTGGQPFLTQKLCNIVLEKWEKNLSIKEIVNNYLIENWEAQDEPTHIKTIRDRLLKNEQKAGRLLGLYQQILLQSYIICDDSPEQTQLRLSGLVVKHEGKLIVYNPIYGTIFNKNWVEKTLLNLRPYGESLTAWLSSNCQDESRLLRGKALQEALIWANSKNLSNQDYQFLGASQELEMIELRERASTNQAEIDRLYREKELLDALTEEQKKRKESEAKLRRYQQLKMEIILRLTAAILAIFASLIGFFLVKSSIDKSNNRLDSLSLLSEALLEEGKIDESLKQSIKAGTELKNSLGINSETRMRILLSLNEAINHKDKSQSQPAHQLNINSINFNPDSEKLVSGSDDKTVKLWSLKDGKLTQLLMIKHQTKVTIVKFSSDGKLIASGSENGIVKIWNLMGEKITEINAHQGNITSISFYKNNTQIATGGMDGKIKLYGINNGKLLQTITGDNQPIKSMIISADGQIIASASHENTVKMCSNTGNLIGILNNHKDKINDVIFSPDEENIATASADKTIKLWDKNGNLLSILRHEEPVKSVRFSPDGQTIVAISEHGIIKFWHNGGILLKTIKINDDNLSGISFSSDGEKIALATVTGHVILWRLNLDFLLQKGLILLNPSN